eukprot:SAG25_NODE_9662_length_363_cov_0.984848_1_plen_55_part_01
MPLYHCRPINFTNANTSPPLPSPSSSSPSSYVCVGVCVWVGRYVASCTGGASRGG